MNPGRYPKGIDCVWLASDKLGHVGAFITAGEGPVPEMAFNQSLEVEEIEGQIYEMPQRTPGQLLVTVPRPDGYLEIAARGLYVYDWTDAGKTTSKATNLYELVAIPSNPLINYDLPIALRTVSSVLRFDLAFSTEACIDVRRRFTCEETGMR
jgi:hypothetical protein